MKQGQLQLDIERAAHDLRSLIPVQASTSSKFTDYLTPSLNGDVEMTESNGQEESKQGNESVQIEYVSMDDTILAPGRVRFN